MSSPGRRFSADVFAESKRRRSRTMTELRRESLNEKPEKTPKELATNALLQREKMLQERVKDQLKYNKVLPYGNIDPRYPPENEPKTPVKGWEKSERGDGSSIHESIKLPPLWVQAYQTPVLRDLSKEAERRVSEPQEISISKMRECRYLRIPKRRSSHPVTASCAFMETLLLEEDAPELASAPALSSTPEDDQPTSE